ncbi:MAG TPA: BamA/TamA family outer membrane protein [Polyangia bacterium]|nr:BamA/TamA family outer membrane protein [Polyangia bacterium]
MSRLLRALLGGALLVVGSSPAAAQILPPLDIYQRYEEQLIADALRQQGLEPDPAPLGKTIERILVVPHDIFLRGFDPVPPFFNIFHVTTKPYIVRQELLFREGDVIGPDTLAESERNLRSFFVLSVARIVVARGSAPDKAIVVVVSKDLWSLRPNTNFVIEGSLSDPKLDLLSFTLAEHNLLGRNKFLGLNIRLDPATYWLGEHYVDPRVLTARIAADEQALFIFNREHGDAEGFIGRFFVGRPLYSLATEWGWDAGVAYENDVARAFQNGAIQMLRFSDQPNLPFRYEYDQRLVNATIDGRRSFGLLWKSNFTAGYRIIANKYTIEPDAMIDPAVLDEFNQRLLPTSEEAAQLFWHYDFFRAEFVTFQDIAAFALTEDFRLGPEASFEIGWAASELGFSSDYLSLGGEIGWRWLLGGDDLFYVNASAGLRYQPHYQNALGWTTNLVNRSLSAGISNVSPLFWHLRFHARAALLLRDYDLTKSQSQLGGTESLRGFPAGRFAGSNVYVVNLELRTKPISLWTLYLGLAAFYDGASAYYSSFGRPDSELSNGVLLPAFYHQDVGIGLRAQLPQFNHFVLRFDLAFPIFEREPADPVAFTATFGQLF